MLRHLRGVVVLRLLQACLRSQPAPHEHGVAVQLKRCPKRGCDVLVANPYLGSQQSQSMECNLTT